MTTDLTMCLHCEAYQPHFCSLIPGSGQHARKPMAFIGISAGIQTRSIMIGIRRLIHYTTAAIMYSKLCIQTVKIGL